MTAIEPFWNQDIDAISKNLLEPPFCTRRRPQVPQVRFSTTPLRLSWIQTRVHSFESNVIPPVPVQLQHKVHDLCKRGFALFSRLVSRKQEEQPQPPEP